MNSFKHKTLGTFTQRDYFDELRWETDLELPAFNPFKYLANGKPRRSRKIPVAIYSDHKPSSSTLNVLSSIKRSQKKLVSNIIETFYRDLHQQGYNDPEEIEGFGMWWSRDPVAVALSCRKALEKRLKQDRIWEPEDLFVVLYEPSIEIRLPEDDKEPIRALVNFGAEFEEEHGVSVLTDGKNVLNLGYAGELG